MIMNMKLKFAFYIKTKKARNNIMQCNINMQRVENGFKDTKRKDIKKGKVNLIIKKKVAKKEEEVKRKVWEV